MIGLERWGVGVDQVKGPALCNLKGLPAGRGGEEQSSSLAWGPQMWGLTGAGRKGEAGVWVARFWVAVGVVGCLEPGKNDRGCSWEGKSVLSWTLEVKSGSGAWGRPGSRILGSR